MPAGPKGQTAWISSCVSEIGAIISVLPFPVSYLNSMTEESLRIFGRSINIDSQIAVICQHASHTNERLRELCTGWVVPAKGQSGQIRWKITDYIQRWRRVSQLQQELLFATVVEPLQDLDQKDVLNVLCVLLPALAPLEAETNVGTAINQGSSLSHLRRRAQSTMQTS